jgi:hypothetical protein
MTLWPDKDLRDFKAELLSVFGNHKIGMFAVLAQIPVFTQSRRFLGKEAFSSFL